MVFVDSKQRNVALAHQPTKDFGPSQTKVYTDVVDDLKSIFITGGGGRGKTFLLNRIVPDLRKKGLSVACITTTGSAATLISGFTICSLLKFPVSWQTRSIA